MSKGQERKAVFLSAELYSKIEDRAKEIGFGSVDEYVIFVLEEILQEEGGGTLSKEDEEEVKKRLKTLGYLD